MDSVSEDNGWVHYSGKGVQSFVQPFHHCVPSAKQNINWLCDLHNLA